MKKILASLFILGLFLYGVGPASLFPSLRLWRDTPIDFSLFPLFLKMKIISILWIVPTALGFVGWVQMLQRGPLRKVEKITAQWLGLAISVSFFSLYVFTLGVNGILYWPLVLLFFSPLIGVKWKSLVLNLSYFKPVGKEGWLIGFGVLTLLLWAFEYFSPPLIWDAILDHYRYAGEVSRLHQIPFHWTNHTGDMPKFVELIFAGFWCLGGEWLAKISGGLAALLMTGLLFLFIREWGGRGERAFLIFWTCPVFLALFAWGYVEGFLAFYEVAALFCLWKALANPKVRTWVYLWTFFMGVALSIKYTAALAFLACGGLWLYESIGNRPFVKWNWSCLLFFLLPLFPWLLKNELANGNPVYPLASAFFGGPSGFNSGMEANLWEDTGAPADLGFTELLNLLWRAFFTSANGVGAAWTPLVLMSLPWAFRALKTRVSFFLVVYAFTFFAAWCLFCTNLRHASGGLVILVLLGTLFWEEAFKDKGKQVKILFAAGCLLALWLTLSAQLTTTAPYASVFGLEDPMKRLRRNYSFNSDTYAAYRGIESHSDPRDKVLAFAVFQTYPLQRTAFVDFKWKMPIFLRWASTCQTAEQLATLLKKQGVTYFLYQKGEAEAMSKMEKDFRLEGMPLKEYIRFWRYFMEPVALYENSHVYRALEKPTARPWDLSCLPGVQEKWEGHKQL